MRVGIDLGGTKIAAVVLDPGGGIAWESRVATPRDDYEGTLDAMVRLVTDAERAVGVTCTVGIGMPGVISPVSGLVKNANSTWLNGRALKVDLERRLRRDVRLANDANCLAISEAIDGAAAGQRVVFGVILGTGTGGGVVVDRHVLTGRNAIAGEWGHNALPWPDADEYPGPPCYCGRRGCIETFLSGPALASDYQRRGGAALSGEQIVQRTGEGDPLAVVVLQAWIQRLAKALATVINLIDPDIVVVGGGLSQIEPLYAEVPRLWADWVFSDVVTTPIVPAQYGDASGVRGAAWLWNARMLP